MKVYELLAIPDRWTKGAYARDINGAIVDCQSGHAACWCLDGAVHRCYPSLTEKANMLDLLDTAIGHQATTWNDAPERTHAEVLELVTRLGI